MGRDLKRSWNYDGEVRLFGLGDPPSLSFVGWDIKQVPRAEHASVSHCAVIAAVGCRERRRRG
jgi:hypothetical protein